MATNANGDYDNSSPISGTGLLEAVLGKSTSQDTNSSQNTNTQSNQDTRTSGWENTSTGQQTNNAQTTNNSTSGSAAQQQTGSQTGTQSQATTGTTTNTGTQAQTGTVQNTGNTINTSTNTQATNADISALQSVFAQQQAGVTPDMLAAIFREGSKAAPQLVTANAQALGARAGSNTPVAAALQGLQLDLTSKAADLNRQMLADSSGTAAKIADLTKTITGTQADTSQSLNTQVQDLLTQNNSQQIVDQIVNAINQQTTQQNTTAQNTQATVNQTQGNTNSYTNQYKDQSQQSVTDATQNQQATATENKNTATTINTGMAKNLLGMAAAGAGLSAIYQAAKSGGFTGAVKDLVGWLSGTGAKVGTDGSIDTGSLAPAWGNLLTGSGNDLGMNLDLSNYYNDSNNYGGIGDGGGFNWDSFGFADGGQVPLVPLLPVPDLLKKPSIVAGNQDGDLMSMLNAMGVGGSIGQGGGDGGGLGGSGGGSGASASDGGDSTNGGSSGASSDMGGYTVNDQGIAVPNSVNPLAINAAFTAAGILGVPVAGLLGKGAAAMAAKDNAANKAAADQFNQATKDTNASINGAPTNAATATAGPQGSGGTAANAGASAAASASQAGYADSAIAAAAQAAANAAIGGATSSAAGIAGIQAGAEAQAGLGGHGIGTTDSIGGDFGFGGDTSSVGGGDMGFSDAQGFGADMGSATAADSIGSGDMGGFGSDADGVGGGDSGGGGCYLTTAALRGSTSGDADNEDLQALRSFRDNVMLKDPQHKKLVEEYYQNAPAIVKGIDSSPDKEKVYSSIQSQYIKPAVAAIKAGKNEEALKVYSDMIASVSSYGGKKGQELGREAVDVAATMQGFANGGYMHAPGSMEGYKDGHQVKGPGTGVSDSIAATGPSGQRIAVAKDEYIIPADVVAAKGTEFFDKLCERYHTPAALQRAMGVE